MLDTRIDLPSAAGIQDVFRHLANDLSRTEAIAAEIESAIGQGRKVLVLTERTEHLDAILKALMEQQLDGSVVNPITERTINTKQTLGLLWLKNNVVPTDWDERHESFDGFDASNGFARFLVSAVAAQLSALKPA